MICPEKLKEGNMGKKNAFTLLAIYMMGFGAIIGIVFPFFAMLLLSIPASQILTPTFFVACITAGLLVGLFNIVLAKRVVGRKISLISKHMTLVQSKLIDMADFKSKQNYLGEEHYISDLSDDEIGVCGSAFNSLMQALSEAIKSESNVRKFTEILSSQLDLTELGEAALSELMRNMNVPAGSIIIEMEGHLELLCSHGIKSPELMLQNEMIWTIAKKMKDLF